MPDQANQNHAPAPKARRSAVRRKTVRTVVGEDAAIAIAHAAGLPAEPSKAAVTASDGTIKPGFIEDFISGRPVKATPEELQAVQVFARRLVEDYGYPRDLIQTRPQYQVHTAPSETRKGYPVDIAVFNKDTKTDDDLFMVVECKRSDRKDGLTQLKTYMDLSRAELGVWFNGDEHVYLWRVFRKGRRPEYREIYSLPRFGQRIEDIGQYQRKGLARPTNLKAIFRDIRNRLAGMTTGIARDEALAQEIINILFCKILDEQQRLPEEPVLFRVGVDEAHADVKKRILELFEEVKDRAFGDVFVASDTIKLDGASLSYVVGELQTYCIMDADRDAIGDAFEVFIGPALRGTEGQFFTPRNVVQMIVDIIDPKPDETIIDPACGSGGFLITALSHVWEHVRKEAETKGWSDAQRARRELRVATDGFRGLDKDSFLAKVCKAYMALVGDGRGGIFSENSLVPPSEWSHQAQDKIGLGKFDVVLTNPPFGAKIKITGDAILAQYELGRGWDYDAGLKAHIQRPTLVDSRPPQVLFIERCFQLLKDGGRMGIVLPESILGNPSWGFLMAFIQRHGRLLGVVTLPEALFKTSGKGGTHTKVAALIVRKEKPSGLPHDIFMSDVKWCGHDSRGNETRRKNRVTGELELLDEVPLVPQRFQEAISGRLKQRDHLGFLLPSTAIRSGILVPKYYNPEITADLSTLTSTHDLIILGSLVETGAIDFSTGVEIGKMAYGTGTIPFIRTSDISNWELKADFKHGVSQEIYEDFVGKVDVQVGDIMMVRDGTYLIGTSAIVTEDDLPMLFQSHIIRIRVLEPDVINPWLLFAALNSPIVKRQIRSKQFTQDIIDTIGRRLAEIAVPIPKEEEERTRIAEAMKSTIEMRARLRRQARQLALDVQGLSQDVGEETLTEIEADT